MGCYPVPRGVVVLEADTNKLWNLVLFFGLTKASSTNEIPSPYLRVKSCNPQWTLIRYTYQVVSLAISALHWVPIPMSVPMGFGWAWVRCYCSWVGIGFVHPCIQLQIRVKLLGCREYANQEVLRAETNNNERLFICPIQPRLGVGG